MIMIAREMTKLHEERYVGTVADALAHFEKPLGEFTIILEAEKSSGSEISNDIIFQRIIDLSKSGWSARDISVEIASNYGLSKRNAYKITIEQLKTSKDTKA
jgi:16S rRNA (cytidine1402-2'-O)-methyltransferase